MGKLKLQIMKVKRFLTLMLILCITVVSCKKDGASTDNGTINPNNPTNYEDPEGTITANLRNDDGYISMFSGEIKLKINSANNFIGIPNGNFDEVFFATVGEIDGLGYVLNIPQSGWSDQIAVIPNNGYIIKFVKEEQNWNPILNAYDPPYYVYKYARVYVVNYILNINNEILGAELKYQDNWLQTASVSIGYVTNITETSATCTGNVTEDGGSTVTERGICWSTLPNPTINNNKASSGSGTGTYTIQMTDLTIGTKYFIRAYAINSIGISYSAPINITTPITDVPIGAIKGLFSVNDTQKVFFSKGNLQYRASTNTWRFADNQNDYIGSTVVYYSWASPSGNVPGSSNHLISPTYDGWIDLFGWGTGNNPTNISTNHEDYETFTEWGNNIIINGGNTANTWRTLTKDEWVYILNTRYTSSGIRYAKATVQNIQGLILVPDNWNPNNYDLHNTNDNSAGYNSNFMIYDVWMDIFEANGAVFLPITGRRCGNSIIINEEYIGNIGMYWSSTKKSTDMSYCLRFDDVYGGHTNADWKDSPIAGQSVRLVRNVN